MYSKIPTSGSISGCWEQIERFRQRLEEADAVLIGAGAGLSASAGFTYSGERFETNFADFIAKYHLTDMYTAGFYPFESPEEKWAYWSRHIWLNRYVPAPKPVYDDLLKLVQGQRLLCSHDQCGPSVSESRVRQAAAFLHPGRLRPVAVLCALPPENL
jgi:hypothetical protein